MTPRLLLAFFLLSPAQSASAQELNAALEAEKRALEAEGAALSAALEEARSRARVAETAVEADIERLTADLARARAANASRAEATPSTERGLALEGQARRLDQLLRRARSWLSTRGATVSASAGPAEVVGSGLKLIHRQGGLRIEKEAWFDDIGRAVEGSVLRIGPLAAFRLGDRPAPLVFTQEGALRTLSLAPAAVQSDDQGVVVSAIVRDPTSNWATTTAPETSIYGYLVRGGPIMWPLTGLGLLAALIVLERTFALLRAAGQIRRLALGQAMPGAIGAPVRLALAAPRADSEAEADIVQALQKTRTHLRRGLFLVGVVASVAPLVGLLGTVTGMIGTFSVITEHGTGDPRLLSDGISQALLTTQLGLTVAIPALLANALLGRFAEGLLASLEEVAVGVWHGRETST